MMFDVLSCGYRVAVSWFSSLALPGLVLSCMVGPGLTCFVSVLWLSCDCLAIVVCLSCVYPVVVLPCPVLSCLVLSSLVLSCLVLSCLVSRYVVCMITSLCLGLHGVSV